MAGLQAVGGPTQAKEMTLNERLNRVNGTIDLDLDAMERLLGRVNDMPNKQEVAGSAPTPMFGLAQIVERIESQAARLQNLVQGLNRIA